ncbi:MAG: hypothetical protein AUG51_19380 [Acidobacteria bacterium 13_1_20CM_3_53_8]|nr:MAG: hypothetical protein AUG51_19380 [Acidobacteria bacterium 13_1_20CM_3_53_8]
MSQIESNAEQIRKRRRTDKEAAAILLTLPSGLKVKAVRPDIETWVMSGRLPQVLLSEVVRAFGSVEQNAASIENKLTGHQVLEAIVFMRDVVREAVVSPRIVIGADPNKNEIEPTDLSKEDSNFIYMWAMAGAVGIPVQMKGGAVSVETLRNFRSDSRLSDALRDSEEVRAVSE